MPYCKHCETEKPRDKFSNGGRKDGTPSYCKECSNKLQREYRARTREKWREYQREWTAKNKEKEAARWAAYRESNREKIREKARERMRKRRAEDPDGTKAYSTEYRKKNKDKVRMYDAKKAAKRRGAIGSDRVTAADWREIKEKYRYCCAYCLKPSKRLTMDHIVPLTKGGRHIASNIAPACRSCNSSKQARDALEWVAEKHGRLL